MLYSPCIGENLQGEKKQLNRNLLKKKIECSGYLNTWIRGEKSKTAILGSMSNGRPRFNSRSHIFLSHLVNNQNFKL